MSQKKPALGFIFVTLLIDITGWGIIIPVVPGLIMELSGGSVSDASSYGGWLIAAYAIMQFIFAPIVGGLSDRYGRRPILLASLFGFGVDYIFTAVAPTLAWLFAGRIVIHRCTYPARQCCSGHCLHSLALSSRDEACVAMLQPAPSRKPSPTNLLRKSS